MSTYASGTDVSASKSRDEIERTLVRFGADSFAYGWEQNRAMVQFRAHNRQIRFGLEMPDRDAKVFTHTPSTNKRRSDAQALKAWEQATRQRWRALVLIVKAKLEAVESGISEFETEFLAHVVLPDGSTVGDFMQPQVEAAYQSGVMPAMLPALEAGR